MSIDGYIETLEKLPAPAQDMHRALAALREELDSIDRYNQRWEACTDPELKLILAASRDKEKEHAAMLMEWIRRRDPRMDVQMKDKLFKAGPITAQHQYGEDA